MKNNRFHIFLSEAERTKVIQTLIDMKNTLVGFASIDGFNEVYSECEASDEYTEVLEIYGARISNEAELFRENLEKSGLTQTPITAEDCFPLDHSMDIHGKIVAMRESSLRPEYQILIPAYRHTKTPNLYLSKSLNKIDSRRCSSKRLKTLISWAFFLNDILSKLQMTITP